MILSFRVTTANGMICLEIASLVNIHKYGEKLIQGRNLIVSPSHQMMQLVETCTVMSPGT